LQQRKQMLAVHGLVFTVKKRQFRLFFDKHS
jgi:hypothetical protein